MNLLRPFAVLALVLGVLAPPVPALDDDQNSVEIAILDILLERGIIDVATYEELRQLSVRQRQTEHELDLLEGQLQRLRAPDVGTQGGKPGKLQFASEDGKWTMGIKGRIQVLATAQRGEGDDNNDADINNISIRRGRIGFAGKAGGENMTYKLEVDAPTEDGVNRGRKDFKLTDAWLNWKLDDSVQVKFGQAKFPFGREVHIASSKINLVNESAASVAFAPAREPLIMAYGTGGEDKFFEWWAAISNGEGQGRPNQSGLDGTGSTGMRQGVRVVVNPLGSVDKDAAAFQTVKDGGTRLALGASFMVNDDRAFDGDGDGEVGDASFDSESLGFEAQVLTGPFSFLAEHFDRDIDVDGGPTGRDSGYNIQGGMLFGEDNDYEIVLRRTVVDLGFEDKRVFSTLGLNIYNDKHNSKWAFDISDIENKTEGDADAVRGRAMYQLVF